MPFDDDLSLPIPTEEIQRRKVLTFLGTGALAVAGSGTALAGLSFLEPRVVYEEDERVGVGRPEDIAPGMVVVVPKHRLYLIRAAAGFCALSSVCTHLGCMTRYQPDSARIVCPCHGSQFSLEGKVTGGPAPRPLRRLQLTVERGVLVVNGGKEVPPGTWLAVT
jgi:Rieske Fe-S protein